MPRPGGTFEAIEHIGEEPGPTVALLGGVHGDEEEGVLAIQRLSAALDAAPLGRGVVRAVAVAHPAAYAVNQRTSPLDGLNLARCFPGNPAGSATERLAHDLTERVIRGSDLLIDLHSAGRDYAMPTFAGYLHTGDEVAARSRRVAVAFGAPLLWEHSPPVPPGRTVSTALELGIPCIYVEGSGGGSLEQAELDLYVDGLFGVLSDLGMTALPLPSRPNPERIVRGAGSDLDVGIAATCSGRFVTRRQAGEILEAGDCIGEIVDDTGRTAATITTPEKATLMFVRRAARIAAGEIVCALGGPATPWSVEARP